MQAISTDRAPKAIGPFAQAIVVDGWIYTSGQIPPSASGEKVNGGIVQQTELSFENLEAILPAGGSSLAKVISASVFMTDLGEFATMNEVYEVYARRFGNHRPARTTVQVAALPTGAQVEIAVTARLDP